MTNLATTLVNTARSYPDRIAVRSDERALRYRDLDELSARVACWLLGRGISAGDRVGLDGTEHTRVRRALLRHPPGRGRRGPDESAVQGP